jgi:hypothetical protein
MAFVLADRVKETTTTTGTGTVTLAGAVSGYQSFTAVGDANTTYYTIAAGTEWEVGLGTYTSSGTTLSRDVVYSSSNAGALVNFSAGTKYVWVDYPAPRAVYFNGSGTVPLVGGTVTANTPIIDATQTWNSSGTTFFGWKLNVTNTASASASRLLNLQVGGTSYFQVDRAGRVYVGSGGVTGIRDEGADRLGLYGNQGLSALVNLGVGLSVSTAYPTAGFGWANLTTTTTDTALLRASAGVVSVNTAASPASDGKLLYREYIIPATTTRSVLSTESGATFTNEGASAEVPFNLPTAVAGLRYRFIIQDADGIQVNAAAGDTIRVAGSVSATAGLVEATTIGNVVELVAINATEWMAIDVIGTWTVT